MKKENMLLQAAANEIINLRKENMMKGARLQMFDDLMLLLRTSPGYGGMESRPDIVREIDEHLKNNPE